MNKKGFTLIEIIGVVTVLSLILIVAVPALTTTLKRNEQNRYDQVISTCKTAAENYVVSKLKEGAFFEDDKDYNYISLGTLIDEGYINEVLINPKNNKNLSRDTRIKVLKQIDGTFNYVIQEYYQTPDSYDQDKLIVHYDSVEYSNNNVFKSYTSVSDYDYSAKGYWTEEGVYLEKDKTSLKTNLNQNYVTDSITISFSIKSLDEINDGGSDYTYPIILYKNNSESARIGFRKKISLFYKSGNNTILSLKDSLAKNKNYTITFVQDGLSSRSVYLNGVLRVKKDNLTLTNVEYNSILISPSLYNLNLNNMLIYNRALSSEEIKDLYELDKARFGK